MYCSLLYKLTISLNQMIHTHPDEQRLQAGYAEKLAVLAKIAGYDAKIVQNSSLDVATGSANWKDWKVEEFPIIFSTI
jgi:hypothetical protein